MLKYETEQGKTIMVICGQKVTEEEAKRKANEHFKLKRDKLEARQGYLLSDGLYWEKTGKKAVRVWAVYKKGTEV